MGGARFVSTALELYPDAIPLFPEFAYAHAQISWAYYLNGQPQNVITSIEQAIRLVNSPQLWMLLREAEINEHAD